MEDTNRRRKITRAAVTALVVLSIRGFSENQRFPEPENFFRRYARLDDEQIESIQRGKAVAKVLDSPTADQVDIFGAVYVKAMPESYLKLASDIAALRRLPSYLAVEKFSAPPQLSDLNDFSLDAEDVKELKDCRPGNCQVQLPAGSMEEFRRSVQWNAPNAVEQANRLARQMALEVVLRYMQGGNAALGDYRDKNHPTNVAETFESLLSRFRPSRSISPNSTSTYSNIPRRTPPM
jgi:hypothetical protein